jgi:hypothetical protein
MTDKQSTAIKSLGLKIHAEIPPRTHNGIEFGGLIYCTDPQCLNTTITFRENFTPEEINSKTNERRRMYYNH